MLLQLVLLAALGATCAGCSAPSLSTALAADDPANPDAASAPFVRPVNVLAEGAALRTSIPSTAMHMASGSMPGMGPGSMPDMSHASGGDAALPGMTMAQATPRTAGQGGKPGFDHGSMPGDPQ